MAIKLYPPQIEGTIPAFCTNKDGVTELVVPFSLNRAVSANEIAGFVVKIKTVQGGVLLWSKEQELNLDGNKAPTDTDELINSRVIFQIPRNIPIIVGQYYKIQLAFASRDEQYNLYPGYFSTVGVTKYTTSPKVEIFGLNLANENNHNFYYTGIYSQENKDFSEKLYSSRFRLEDSTGLLIYDSGEIIHNISLDDNSYEAVEDVHISQDLERDKTYYLQYIATSTNGLVTKSPRYKLLQKKSIAPEINAHLDVNLSFDDGFIDLYLVGDLNSQGYEDLASGDFLICRAASNENYTWNKIYEFSLKAEQPTRFLWRDYTIEQGVTYQYSLQQYNSSNLYSERILSKKIIADFEDSFLYDGERQLKIRYNPKISSFKTDILESKVETIGHKYPFIFRNGNVYYKEFPISGLISYKMDENSLFLKKSELELDETPKDNTLAGGLINKLRLETTDLVSYNLYAERLFKTEVLNWLNNGKPKLFKSPAEGNFIVQLMGVTLTPEDSLGRMLHNFSCTAYEIQDYLFINLVNLGLLKIENVSSNIRKWSTIELAGKDAELDALLESVRRYTEAGVAVAFSSIQYNRLINYNNKIANLFYDRTEGLNQTRILKIIDLPTKKQQEEALLMLEDAMNKVTYVTGVLNSYPISSIKIMDMLPGTQIQIQESITSTPFQIQIGVTGSYSANFNPPVYRIEIPSDQHNPNLIDSRPQGSVTIGYDAAISSSFESIEDFEVKNIPVQQWIGKPEKTYYDFSDGYYKTTNNLIDVIEDVKRSVVDFFWLRFYARPIQQLFIRDLEIKEDLLGVSEEEYSEKGFYFERVSVSQSDYKYNYYYTMRSENIVGSSVRKKIYSLSRGVYSAQETYYIKKCNKFYYDMDCKREINFDDLDCWCVYAICHGRFDYTYSNLHFEQYYIDSNFNHGYYIDKDGQKTMVFTGQLMDGKSTKDNKIFYSEDTYSNKIQLNGAEIDLSEKKKIVLKKWDGPIKTLFFDNGIICEAAYQLRETTYKLEASHSATKSTKAVYNTNYNNFINYFTEENYKNALANKNLPTYLKQEYILLDRVNTSYTSFIKQLEIALFQEKQNKGE